MDLPLQVDTITYHIVKIVTIHLTTSYLVITILKLKTITILKLYLVPRFLRLMVMVPLLVGRMSHLIHGILQILMLQLVITPLQIPTHYQVLTLNMPKEICRISVE